MSLPHITTISFDGDATLWDFEIALRQAGCSTEQLVHVGDSLETDVLGAKNAGVPSVWLNRDGVENRTDVIPDFEIQTLAELAPILSGIGESP